MPRSRKARSRVAALTAVCAAALSAILVASAGGQSAEPNRTDVTFAQMMSRHHVQGIANAERAVEKATNAQVRELARKQAREQRRERQQLMAFLKRDDVPDLKEPAVSQAQRQHDRWELQQLDAAQGEEFDRLFLMFQTDHHLAGTMMADMELRGGSATTIKRIAAAIKKAQTSEAGQMERILGVPRIQD